MHDVLGIGDVEVVLEARLDVVCVEDSHLGAMLEALGA